jgi:hypothetical protein
MMPTTAAWLIWKPSLGGGDGLALGVPVGLAVDGTASNGCGGGQRPRSRNGTGLMRDGESGVQPAQRKPLHHAPFANMYRLLSSQPTANRPPGPMASEDCTLLSVPCIHT